MESVDAIEKKKKKAESKKKDTQEDLENVNAGKKSVRTLFKNAGCMLKKWVSYWIEFHAI